MQEIADEIDVYLQYYKRDYSAGGEARNRYMTELREMQRRLSVYQSVRAKYNDIISNSESVDEE